MSKPRSLMDCWPVRALCIAAIVCACLTTPVFATIAVGQNTSGLPLPRFVSFRADEINMRTGPGVQYPVDWVYARRGLPVEIIAEYETWRKVRDWEGTQGWVHQSMLSGKRTVIVTGEMRNLRASPDAGSRLIARVEPGVIGELSDCSGGWCRIAFGAEQGWLRHVDMWGVYKEEAFE